MTKKKYVTTSSDPKERYKERNRQAAAAFRKNRENALKASQDKNAALKASQEHNAALKARNAILQTNIALCKQKIFCTDALLKENQQMKKQLRGIEKQLLEKNAKIKELSIMILEM